MAAVVAVVAAAVVASAAVAVAAAAVVTAAAIGVVVAEGGSAELVASVTSSEGEVTGGSQPLPANSNARSARGTGEVSPRAAQAPAAEPAPESRPAAVPTELVSLANEIGQAWSQTYVRLLQEQERDIVGAWPGTIREARRQVLARIKTKLEPEQLDQLARITNLAARRGWETVSEPDLES